MDSLSFPFKSPDPVAPAEISVSAPAETTSTVHEHIPTLQEAYGMLGIEELRAREIAIAPNPQLANENAPETAIVAEGSDLEKKSIEEVAFGPQSLPVDATHEKTTPANMLEFFGLQQQPFDVTPDPAYLYFSPSHREALTTLKQGIEHFRGFMMLVAEPGMGKTTLLHKLMEELSDSARVVFLFQTQCSSRELLCFILNELEVDHTGMDVVAMHRALNQALLEEMLRGRRFVLVVDEAQNLQEPVLETIRLLSDFETTHSKLIQIVLAGQPQIAETLMRPSLVQLRQRIAVLASLKSLSARRDRGVHRAPPARRGLERQTAFLQRRSGSDRGIQRRRSPQHQQFVLQRAARGLSPRIGSRRRGHREGSGGEAEPGIAGAASATDADSSAVRRAGGSHRRDATRARAGRRAHRGSPAGHELRELHWATSRNPKSS